MGLRLGDPLKPARVSLCGIAAHDDGQIRVTDVRPGICHRAATERRAQTGHRRSVSDARLIVERQNARAAYDFVCQIRGLVAGRGSGKEADRSSND